MQGFFDAIYSKFILRDLFSKIVPGAIFLCTALLLFDGNLSCILLHGDFSPAVWAILYGIAWILGLALQSLGEVLGLLKFHIYGTDQKYRSRRIRAHRLATERESHELERYLVIKETTGISSIALFLFAAVRFVSLYYVHPGPFWPTAIPSILVVLTASLLYWMHRHMVKVECEFMENVIEAGATKSDE
jgi:hypothetical protein